MKTKFHIGRVCLVADRGMISEETKKEIKKLGWQYILGVRMRRVKEVRDLVVSDESPFEDVTFF